MFSNDSIMIYMAKVVKENMSSQYLVSFGHLSLVLHVLTGAKTRKYKKEEFIYWKKSKVLRLIPN